MILGVDPGMRHVGLCVLTDAGPTFWEVKPTQTDVLSCLREIDRQLGAWRANHNPKAICMERQLSVGGQSSALMFACQMKVAEALELDDPEVKVVAPLPVQLRSYIKKVHKGDISSASATVAHFRATHNWKPRISQHCVDAYYLCRLAKDVMEGRWEYKLPSNEQQLFPGVIYHGPSHRPHQ